MLQNCAIHPRLKAGAFLRGRVKAYFLGLMFSDGNLYITKKNNYAISLCLQEKDKAIIETFRDYIAPEHKIYFVNKQNSKWHRQNQYKLLFYNAIIGKQLIKLGCIPAKSLKLEFPILEKHLIRHFIRGYFDGDGCISSYKRKNGYNSFSISLTSTQNFCIATKQILQTELNIAPTLYMRFANGITAELSFGGNQQIYKFMNWLYDDATVCLQRKHEKFLELKASLSQKPSHKTKSPGTCQEPQI